MPTDRDAVDQQWYWDKKRRKAYYPVATDGSTVHFLTVWHRDEVESALAEDQVVPYEEMDGGYDTLEPWLDAVDSFRLLSEEELAGYTGADDD